ncbi:MAG: alpha/beta fold hydrolase [Ramlibacter sp.]|nr:alpha/beta fold hydrolase [Ramlibacter sp.]
MAELLLIPGLAADAVMWQSQLHALADPWKPHVAEAHQNEARIEDMAAALLKAHTGPLVLCGASMGGMIAMEMARQAPQRIEALALLGTNARPETPEMHDLREAAIRLFEQGQVREVIEPNVALAFHPAQAANPALVQAYLDFVLAAGTERLIRQNRAVMARPDARLHLPRLRCPVLVMWGDADQLTPPECSHEIAALVPEATRVEVPRCGHMLTMEQPEAVNAALRSWLGRLA